MKYEIKNRFTGSVLFEADIECASDAPDSLKLGLAVKQAVKANANLARANLAGADLTNANLTNANLAGADLTNANLVGAKWSDGVTITKDPIQISGLAYQVLIFDTHMQIGCELHTFEDWNEFDDERIAQMDGLKARRFWRDYKSTLMALCMS